MSRSASDAFGRGLGAAVLTLVLCAAAVTAQEADAAAAAEAEAAAVEAQAGPIVASQIELSRDGAMLELELADGRRLRMAVQDGRAILDGRAIGDAPRGAALDRAWRDLLDRAIDAPAAELTALLVDWDPPSGALADQFDQTLEAALSGTLANLPAPAQEAIEQTARTRDSIDRLLERIEELEDRAVRVAPRVVVERDGGFEWLGPFRYVAHGFAGLLSLLVGYGVLFGIGFLAIMFGGRKYIEGVADTARHATMRSLFVGLAGSFLVIPAFILGIIALAISIIGIPALLAWIPLFPVAVALAVLLGYLAVAHAAGEALAERRFYAADWFQRGNSYYFLLTGLGLLFALFIGAQVVYMAGPWLGFFHGLLTFLGVMVTWVAASIGFGAVLVSRAGTRPIRGPAAAPEIFAEETHV